MHELGRYLQRNLEDRGWTVSELIRRSGLSRQTVYNILNDTREHMEQTPQRKTVNGLAKALGVTQTEVLTVSALAIGVPLEAPAPGQTLDKATDEQILQELASRLSRSKGQDNESEASSKSPRGHQLRAVGTDSDHPGTKQKTGPEGFSITEIHGAETTKYPAPPREQLAAHPPFKTTRELLDETTGEPDDQSPEDFD